MCCPQSVHLKRELTTVVQHPYGGARASPEPEHLRHHAQRLHEMLQESHNLANHPSCLWVSSVHSEVPRPAADLSVAPARDISAPQPLLLPGHPRRCACDPGPPLASPKSRPVNNQPLLQFSFSPEQGLHIEITWRGGAFPPSILDHSPDQLLLAPRAEQASGIRLAQAIPTHSSWLLRSGVPGRARWRGAERPASAHSVQVCGPRSLPRKDCAAEPAVHPIASHSRAITSLLPSAKPRQALVTPSHGAEAISPGCREAGMWL